MDIFIETYNLSKLNHKVENLKRLIMSKELDQSEISQQKILGSDVLTGEFYNIFKEELMPFLFKLFQKLKRNKYFQTDFIRSLLS